MRAKASLQFPLILASLVCIVLAAFGAHTSLAVSAAFSPHLLWPAQETKTGYFAEGAN